MTVRTIINLGRGYRLRQHDRLNWQLEEFRSADRNHHKTKDASAKWRPCDRYFQSVRGALVWIVDHEMLTDGGEWDVRDVYGRELGILREVAQAAEAIEAAPGNEADKGVNQ